MSGLKRRLGVFGGSFDPPHGGHLHAARAAAAAFALDHVLFVPAARPPHKPGRSLASGAHRVALLELLLGTSREFSVDPRELSRSGPSFTVETLRELAEAAQDELFLILGTDNLAGLPAWREVERILELARPIVIMRAMPGIEPLQELRGKLSALALERLEEGLVRLPEVRVSSTELRRELRGGQAPGEFLPQALKQYIHAHGLYLEQD